MKLENYHIAHIRNECRRLVKETQDFNDGKQYIGETVQDVLDTFPELDFDIVNDFVTSELKAMY